MLICSKCNQENADGVSFCRQCGARLIRSELVVEFAYKCSKRFEELRGDGNLNRFCDTCGFDVVNLDPLDAEARLRIFSEAAKSPERLCVSVTSPVENTKACPSSGVSSGPPPLPSNPIPTAGLPARPSEDVLNRERERIDIFGPPTKITIEPLPESAWSKFVSKLKFW